ncbi:MAG: hypothetical protein ACK4N5_04825 [Myxococcales bacterium]
MPQRSLRHIILLTAALLGACGEEPPVVTSLAPAAGVYGAELTITGSNLRPDAGSLWIDLGEPPVQFVPEPGKRWVEISDEPLRLLDTHPAVQRWTAEEIVFRYPFPAEGPVTVRTANGEASAAPFQPTWIPGVPGGVLGKGETIVDAVAGAEGRVHVLLQNDAATRLLSFGGTPKPEAHVVAQAPDRVAATRLVASGDRVSGLAISGSVRGHLMQLRWEGDAPRLVETGITSVREKAILAAGTEPSGAWAWLRREADGKVVRVRERSGAWILDRGPFDVPEKLHSSPSAAVDAAGTLYLTYGVDASERVLLFLDNMEAPRVVRLREGDAAFGKEEVPGGPVDDHIISTRLEVAADGRVLLSWCSDDSALLFLNTRLCQQRLLGADGTWQPPPGPQQPKCLEYAFTPTALAAGHCDADAVHVAPVAGGEAEVVVWPAASLHRLMVEPTGALRPLVSFGDRLYAPRRR